MLPAGGLLEVDVGRRVDPDGGEGLAECRGQGVAQVHGSAKSSVSVARSLPGRAREAPMVVRRPL